MGACFVSLTFDGKLTRDQVRRKFAEAQDQDRHENGHSYSGGIGMARGLELTSRQFKTYDEGEQWLADNSQKWEAAKAVRIEADNIWLVGAWCSS
jgi:hypothetical protein